MLDQCVTVCRIKVYFCVGPVSPKMSLSHHNTLYLKQPLLKATRFIPLRQLKLPFGLWSVLDWPCPLCSLQGFGYISCSCCSILWMLWVVCFACPWCSCKGVIDCDWIWNNPDILVKLWTKRKSLGDDMLDKCVTVCRIKVYFCVGPKCISVSDLCRPRWVYHITTPFIWSNLCWKQLGSSLWGNWNCLSVFEVSLIDLVHCVYCGISATSVAHVAASCECCGCLLCLSMMFLQGCDWLRLDLE